MSERSRLNRVLKAYNENPVKNITAKLITGGDEEGIHFESFHGYCANVYSNGTISVPMVESSLATLKVDYPEMHDLVLTISTDLKILELREKNTRSYVFDDSYDEQVVKEALKDWRQSTGCFVCLDESQKADLYNELLRRESETLLMSTTGQIKQWFRDQDIPFIPEGVATITVDGEKGEIRFDSTIKEPQPSQTDRVQAYTFKCTMGDDGRCDDLMRQAVKELLATFGVPPKKE